MGRGREASKYVDLQGHKDLIEAAKAASAQHFVYTSVYHFGLECDLVPVFQFKREVERYLQASGLSYTILRPTAFKESHADMFIGQPILERGGVSLFGKGENLRSFVAADDVAQLAVMALEDVSLNGRTIDIGGPENLTNMDVVRLYEKMVGRPAKVSHVPLGMLQVMFRLLWTLHSGLSQIMQFSIYADTRNGSFDPASMLAAYLVSLTRLEDWAAQRMEQGAAAPSLAQA